jgi:hypothetical protein
MQTSAATMENSVKAPETIRNRIAICFSNLSKEMKSICQTDIHRIFCTNFLHSSNIKSGSTLLYNFPVSSDLSIYAIDG